MLDRVAVKTYAEEILKENGLTDVFWTGPVDYLLQPFGIVQELIAVWFKFNGEQKFTPFADVEQEWRKFDVDKQIAAWIQKTQEEVNAYLEDKPELRLKINIIKCECGSIHTTHPNLHSYWCPIYKR